MSIRIICLLIGYGCGLFQTGVIYGKAEHFDIRHKGSGNAGMTNYIREKGWKSGLIVLAGDYFKTVAAMLVCWLLFRDALPGGRMLLMLWGGFGAMLGHAFPFYLKFRGGKSVACSVAIIPIEDWRIGIICTICFFIGILKTGFMSVGSLLILSSYLVQVLIFGSLGWLWMDSAYLTEFYILSACMTALVFFLHRENIKRLARGEENKFRAHKESGNEDQN